MDYKTKNNIKKIVLENADKTKPPITVVKFNSPVTSCHFTINQLLKIIELWIIGEEIKYPQEKGFKGRWMLFDEIKKVFDNAGLPK